MGAIKNYIQLQDMGLDAKRAGGRLVGPSVGWGWEGGGKGEMERTPPRACTNRREAGSTRGRLG